METETIEQQPVETPQNLTEIISNASKTLEPGADKKPETEKKAEPKEKAEKTADPDELTPEEIERGKNLIRALKDPDQAPLVIDYLAKGSGYTKAEIKELKEDLSGGTKTEQKDAKDEILALFAEQFGEEFAGKMVPMINKAIQKGVEDQTKGIKETFESRELKELENQSITALDRITSRFYGPEAKELPAEITKEMDKLMDTYKPTTGQTLEDYLTDIYSLAAAKKGGSLKPFDSKDVDNLKKVERNRSDVPSRLAGGKSITPSKDQAADPIPHIKNPLDRAIALAKLDLDSQKQ